ncbi:MAG: hypothetical protein FWE25_00270 [Lachnospiraceae bacterium]|nr:hypothetical protein [Lachnospiraceae bacterium]
MMKNAFFFMSIGLLVFLLGAVNQAGEIYNPIFVIPAILLIAIGGILFYKGHKKHRKEKEEEKDDAAQ